MIRLANEKALGLALCFTFCNPSLAQQVVTTVAGSPANFEIQSKVVSAEMKRCGIVLTLPNGSKEVHILEEPSFKKDLSYTPMTQGTAVISWDGEYIMDGKVANPVAGGVKQLFSNIGELLTFSEMTQLAIPCPGNGTITIVATAMAQPKIPTEATSTQTTNKFRSTATIPKVLNQPIEISAFKAKYTSDPEYRSMVDDFNVNRSKKSLSSLRLYSELGDANAQFLYGLAHLEDWTGIYNPKRACYWIREAAVQGLSQARLVLANKAVYNKDCFDITPTLEEAKTWAQLASMSTERVVKENAEKLLQDILRMQITNQ